MVLELHLPPPASTPPPKQGTYIDTYGTIVREDCDCYDSEGQLLFKFRKGVIPKTLTKVAGDTFRAHAQKVSKTRGYASNNAPTTSNIAGFYDRKTAGHHRQGLRNPSKDALLCRTTYFNAKNAEKFEESLPFFKKINDVYETLTPEKYAVQKAQCDKVMPSLLIKDTVFSTITVNRNWRTACHVDKGDFSGGLGNLVVVGNDRYTGGEIGFPRWDVGVDVRDGDMIVMNVHEVHANLAITPTAEDAERMSFVCYLRENMHKCVQHLPS